MRAEKTSEIITALKKVRAENGYTMQRILDMVLDNGGNMSLTTVKKVFSEGSENMNFRYEDSIQPIADVLLKVSAAPKSDEPEVDALRQLVQLKNAIIEETRLELSRTREREAEIRAEAQTKIDYLKERIVYLQQQRDRDDRLLNERRDFIYRKEDEVKDLKRSNLLYRLVIIGYVIFEIVTPFGMIQLANWIS